MSKKASLGDGWFACAPLAAAGETKWRKVMKILVAEDDRVYQMLLCSVLRKWGYLPIMVADGEKAWETLNSPNGPQLAILDWMMPGMDGIEICSNVRGAGLSHYVYIVLLTSKTDMGDLLKGLEAGADDYLPKPVNLHQLKLRLRAAARVLKAEKRHRMIAEMASDGILSFDRTGRIQFANHSAGAIFGVETNELIGVAFDDLVPTFRQIQLSEIEPLTPPSAAPGRSWAPMELRGRHRSGRSMLLEVSFAESAEEAQEPLITAVVRDETERKLRDGQRAHVQKLESIGQLAAGVAHEINTPIQYIGDNLQFIRAAFKAMEQALADVPRVAATVLPPPSDAGGPPGDQRSLEDSELEFFMQETHPAIDQAIEGVHRVAEIVRALKEFSHPGSEDAAPIDLNHMLENAALVSRNRWKYVAELTTDLDATLPPVRCLAGELNQVFLNLIVNAADAIASALQKDPDRKGQLRIASRRDEAIAEVRVTDNGTGIAHDVASRVFDPFFTTKGVGSGTGQGLSIAYTIVARKHGGTIGFETEPGAGTTFIVRLPIEGRENQVSAPEAQLVGGEVS